ncbi:hypothetical protein TPR58_12620 [Sphingomonas sp. HF-S3]|uniref:Uncharacterized protein n=2 Tax=Sphingomonas rustica TaxID=3103142 RepID=A0ABV0BBA7_9SPHN
MPEWARDYFLNLMETLSMPSLTLRSSGFLVAMCAATLGTAGVAHAEAAPCPASNFDGFLKAFSDSAQVQRSFTAPTVQVTEIDATAEPEPREMTRSQPRASLRFPVMMSTADQSSDGLSASVTRPDAETVRVKLEKPDTGYQLSYSFRPRGNCWELFAKADTSL